MIGPELGLLQPARPDMEGAAELRHQLLGAVAEIDVVATQNIDGESVGLLNKLFGKLYEINLASRKVKEWNCDVYYTLKYSLTALILGLIVLSALR
ncbi:aspartyl/asparaginyl beta-hydroxylase (cupin superfamily) [Bradyrhizobium sp. USDA 3650]